MSNTVQPAAESNIFNKALVAFVTNLLSLFVLAYFSWVQGVWQIQALTLCAGVGVVISTVGIWLIKRDKPVLGAWLIIGVSLFIALAAGLLISNIGLLLAAITILSISLSAGQLLPRKHVVWALVAGFITGVFVGVLDQLYLPYRWEAANQNTPVVIVIVAIIVVGYGYFLWRDFKNYSLRTKLIVTFVTVTLLSLGLLVFLNQLVTRQILSNNANDRLLARAEEVASDIDLFIETNLNSIRTDSQVPVLRDYLELSPETRQQDIIKRIEVETFLRAFTGKNPIHIASYALLDNQGRNIADTINNDVGLDESNQDYFKAAVETGQPYVSPVIFFEDSGQAFLYFSSPIYGVADELLGVLRVRYRSAVLQELISANNSVSGEGSFGVLFDENYIHLAHGTDPDVIFKATGPLESDEIAALQANGRLPNLPPEELSTNLPDLVQKLDEANEDNPFFSATDVSTGDSINQVAAVNVQNQPWTVAFFQPQEIFLALLNEQTRSTLFAAIFVAFAVTAAAVVLGQVLTNPIIRLTNVAQEVTGGNLAVKAQVDSEDEIGQLSTAFNSMTRQLQNLIGSLEEQVQSRTFELALSMEVGQRAVAIRDLDNLLPTITEFIRERFNLYYVHIYFVDDLGQNLVIKYGTGTVGQALMERNHSLPIGLGSIVGQVAASSQPIVVSNTETSDIHQPNPLLPNTRSELAIPLIVEDKVIGVLDMQASQVNTFTSHNLTVFEAMATQLSISIDSAQQWELFQETQHKLEETLKQTTHEQWAERLGGRREALGYAYDLSAIKPLQSTDFYGGVSAPVIVQNQPIGKLAVSVPENRKLSEDEVALLNSVAQQLAQKAENLRLFEETQQQATREQLARQITDKIRSSRDIETALNTAARELSAALGVTKAQVNLEISALDEEDNS